MTGSFSLLSWGFAASALLSLGTALLSWDGPPGRRLAGSFALKASGLVTALFGWGALGLGGRESAPSASAAFWVVASYALLSAVFEWGVFSRLKDPSDRAQAPKGVSFPRARDFVKRYPEKAPFDAPAPPPQADRMEAPRRERGITGDDLSPRDLFGSQADALRREMESLGLKAPPRDGPP